MQAEQLISSMFSAIDDNAFERLAGCMDTAVVYERPGYEPIIGYDALLDFYRKTRRIRLGRHDLHRVLCQGEDVVSCGLFTGELKNGEPVTIDFSEIYRLNEQRTRILFRKTYFFQAAI